MRIKVYQINQERDKLRVKFSGLREMQDVRRSHGQSALPDPKIYDEVFSGEVDCKTLEGVYTMVNTNHPPFHRGHSLSVSDVVDVSASSGGHFSGAFYCDVAGFAPIEFDSALAHRPGNLLRVVALEAGKPAYMAEVADELRAFQQTVRGRIEVAYPFEGNAVLVCNEEGLILGMEANRIIGGSVYVGPVFIIGDGGDGNFCSLPDEQVERYLAEFHSPELSAPVEDLDAGITMM